MAMDAAKIGTFDWNIGSGEIYWSPNLESMMGLPAGGFEGNFQAFEKYVYPEDLPRVQRAVMDATQCGGDYRTEFRMVRPDGTLRWVQARGRFFFDHAGVPLRMVGIDIDISDRKRVEDELVRSQAEAKARADDLAAILDAVPAMTFIAHDPECRTMTSSRAAYEMLRMTPGANSSKSAPPDERPNHFQTTKDGRLLSPEELPVQRAAATGEGVRNAEMSLDFDDGTSINIFGHAVPLMDGDKVRGAVGAFIDITDLKRAQEEVRKSESRLRRFVDSNLIGIFTSTLDENFIRANDTFLNMLGYSREEFESRKFNWVELTPPELRERGEQAVAELRATGVFPPFEKEYFRKDGSRVPILIGGAVISETPLEWMCFVLDLTERRRIEELKTKERIQRELLEHEILAREEERRAIARELHDESGQMLASLLAGLRLIEDAKDLKEAKGQVQALKKIAGLTMDELGRLSRGLHPLALDDLGLKAALKTCVDDFRRLQRIQVKLRVVGLDSRRLAKNTEAGLYRIVQEALTNISKHARASKVGILLNVGSKFVDLEISDDGQGFDPELVTGNGRHMGLQGMRERAAMLGGEFTLQSRRGEGTIKTFHIPAAFSKSQERSRA